MYPERRHASRPSEAFVRRKNKRGKSQQEESKGTKASEQIRSPRKAYVKRVAR